ncbi:general secretion pathway protein GspK [Salidesulfovibrio onnuriiensis]|uniref:general secretion pathway protein GspK n=1 Tax=Salidesulfovibrio onnuriiensis TaxID=2583823 RepID=UPI0016502F27|nr:type II secretion system protein GspK [Salidesulfovibrio onnuriiensis]
MISRRENREGAVLVVVLLVMAAAVALILECGKYLRIDYAGAACQRSMVAGGALLRSGLDVARHELLEDLRRNGDRADHGFDDWARIDEKFADLSRSLQSGELTGSVTPENGRISLNALGGEEDRAKALGGVFVRLVESLCRRHGLQADPEDYLASIKVWLGGQDLLRDRGWYAMQAPAYSPPGRQFRTPQELLLVRWRGMSAEDRRRVYYGSGDVPGLREFVTAWDEGTINVNVARPEVLAALPPDARFRNEFVRVVMNYRSRGENLLSGQWYDDIARRLGLDMERFPSAVLGVRSMVFRVEIAAEVGAGRLRCTSVVRREPDRCVVLWENIH